MSTTDGRPTNALFGFTSMLFNILEKERPDAIVVALDAPGKTFRHAEYSEYKGTRKETQDELRVQLTASREFIRALGIPSVEVVGFEADDVVGTIAKKAEANGYETTIVTGDLDALQLVDDHISVLTPRVGVSDTFTYDTQAVVDRYGIGPEFIADFKALKGDSSDNITGVPGIGDKGAADMVQKFGHVENLVEHFDELEPKYLKKCQGMESHILLCKMLATIVCDVPLQYDFEPFFLTQDELDSAIGFLESFEMKSLSRRGPAILRPYLNLGGESRSIQVEVVQESVLVQEIQIGSQSELMKWIGESQFAAYVPPILSRGLFDQEIDAYVAVGIQSAKVPSEWAINTIFQIPLQANLHDAKPLWRLGGPDAPYSPPNFDTQLGAFVLQSARSSYSLRDLMTGYLDVSAPTDHHQLAVGIGQLAPILMERLEKEGQTAIYREIEAPLMPILSQMEMVGIQANRSDFKEFSQLLEVEIEKSQAKIYELAGQTFLIGSPKQLGEVLFDKMQLPGAQKTKTGYATGVEVLGELAATHEIAREVLSWRELSKLKSTYADSLEKLIADDGRIHTTYNQTGAATGRLNSNDPNLQNIPIRSEIGRPIRKAFRAAEGYRLASLDYSQIELRVLAHLCEEPALVKAFTEGEDVHSVTAQSVFNLADAAPTKEQRRLAKMLNYAVLYGVTGHGLARQLGPAFSISESNDLIKSYNERFPSVYGFTRSLIQEAKSKGFTATMKGRRRYFPDIHAPRMQERQYAERQAMNAPIQGAAADMLKLAMIQVHRLLENAKTRMLLSVHDELVFEVAPEEEHEILPKIADAMKNALVLNVPVEVDGKIGNNWDEMEVLKF